MSAVCRHAEGYCNNVPHKLLQLEGFQRSLYVMVFIANARYFRRFFSSKIFK